MQTSRFKGVRPRRTFFGVPADEFPQFSSVVQLSLCRYANQTRNLESGSGRGHVSNDAIDSRAVELNRAGLEYSLS
jgi:hypothetical protein